MSPYASPAWGSLCFDGAEAGWGSLVVRRWRQYASADVIIPAARHQLVTTLLSGWKRVAVLHGARWDTAVVGPGTVSTTPPGQATRLRWSAGSAEPLDHLEVELPRRTMRRVADELWADSPGSVAVSDRLAVRDGLLPPILTGILHAARRGEPELYAETAAEFLAVHLLTRHGGRVPHTGSGHEDVRVARIVELLHERVDGEVGLRELAEQVGLGRAHLIEVFRTATGETPNRYLTRLRIERARELLGRTRLPVAAVARQCGYADVPQFSRAFRRALGTSPSQYRRERA